MLTAHTQKMTVYMFGLGKKDEHGKQVRVEHRGKYTRASRTGGLSLRAHKKFGRLNVTANSSNGLRLSSRVANGTRIALQNGKFRLIGRWRAGPLGLNLSKSGISSSVKNNFGAFNFMKPQYSSFKIAGIQLRGRKAAQLQVLYMTIMGILLVFASVVKLAILIVWAASLVVSLAIDMTVGFFRGAFAKPEQKPGAEAGAGPKHAPDNNN